MKVLTPFLLLLTILTLHTGLAGDLTQPSSPSGASDGCVETFSEQKNATKADRERAVKALKARLAPLMKYDIEDLTLALTVKVRQKYSGARIFAADQNRTFLGTIGSEFAADSIFNTVGQHGSSFSAKSIWNEFGRFGGTVAIYSPFNDVAVSPPLIVKANRVIGHLTVNKITRGAVDPNWLKLYFTN